MRKRLLFSIASAMLIGFATTAQAQHQREISTPGPNGAFPIAVGDVPMDFTNGGVEFIAQDSVSKSGIPAQIVLTSGKKKFEYIITTGVILGPAPVQPVLPFSRKDSVNIVVTSPGYRTVKEKIRIKPDQYICIRMAPIQE